MNSPILTIAVAAWALVGLPSLCTAGVLTHPCAPESAVHPDQEHGHDHDENPGESQCQHESDCAQDPCSELTIRNDSDELPIPTDELHPCADAVPVVNVPGISPNDFASRYRDMLPIPDLACAESALPLLI